MLVSELVEWLKMLPQDWPLKVGIADYSCELEQITISPVHETVTLWNETDTASLIKD